MDKKPNGTEQEKEVKQQQTNDHDIINIAVHQKRVAMLEDLIKTMEAHKANGMLLLAKYDHSVFINNKKFIPYFVNLMNISYEAIRESVTLSCAVELLQMKADLLEKALLKLASRTLPSEDDVEGQKDVEKEQNELDEILEKLELQKKKETLEAFQRIDKIRQDLLRDAVV